VDSAGDRQRGGGDDAAALAARERLAPLLAGIQDPFLHAVSQLVMASISAIAGDFDGARRGALASLERLRAQDEPFWAAVAASTAGVEEIAEGRYDDALGHLTEVRDLGEQVDNARLIAWSRAQLGTLALVQGRLDDAWELLDEGLDLSLASYSTRNVTLYLAAFAQLALAEGDAEQAALLAGAADGLRRRVGLGVWPLLRRGEAELVAQIRQAMGADRFDEVFAAGARLNQPEAVAAVRDGTAPRPPEWRVNRQPRLGGFAGTFSSPTSTPRPRPARAVGPGRPRRARPGRRSGGPAP
jgi:tetratricopeptide (TPR) repeat protein